MDARWLFLLTDVDGLYTANPHTDPSATRSEVVENINELDVDLGGAGHRPLPAAAQDLGAQPRLLCAHAAGRRLVGLPRGGRAQGHAR